MGSVTRITNSSQAVVQSYSYDSFGNSSSVGSIDQPYRFTGREYDSETGLNYHRARYLDLSVGRWLSRDPIGFAAGDVNLYGYVQNNPVNFIDPTGEFGILLRIASSPAGQRVATYIERFGNQILALLRSAPTSTIQGPFGSISTNTIQALANSSGPTTTVFTRLTQSPTAGRALSVAVGNPCLSNAARQGGQLFTANIPTALINSLEQAGLVTRTTTLMGNTVATELRFSPAVTQYVAGMFR